MGKLISLTDLDFKSFITSATLPVLVDFWAPWCAPCRTIAPALERLADKYQDQLIIVKLDIDDAQEIAMELSITAIPTMIIFDNEGKPISSTTGAYPESKIDQFITHALGKIPA
jgi:thioredoxin 1